jgi:hypothetical protein
MKLTTHLQLVPRSRKCGCIHPFPSTPSWRSAELVKHGDSFTIFYTPLKTHCPDRDFRCLSRLLEETSEWCIEKTTYHFFPSPFHFRITISYLISRSMTSVCTTSVFKYQVTFNFVTFTYITEPIFTTM